MVAGATGAEATGAEATWAEATVEEPLSLSMDAPSRVPECPSAASSTLAERGICSSRETRRRLCSSTQIATQPISHRALEATRSARAHGEQLRLPILCFACCT